MNAITVLYDEACPLCIRAARWLANQDTYFPVECLAGGSRTAQQRYGLALSPGKKELTVVDDAGGVYRSTDAWIVCLFALVDYREWSVRFATPALKPLARKLFETLSASRRRISWLLWADELTLRENLEREHAAATGGVSCDDGSCELPVIDASPYPP